MLDMKHRGGRITWEVIDGFYIFGSLGCRFLLGSPAFCLLLVLPSLLCSSLLSLAQPFVRNIPSYSFLCIPILLQDTRLHKTMWYFSLIYLSGPWDLANHQVVTVCISGEGMCGQRWSAQEANLRASHKDIVNVVSQDNILACLCSALKNVHEYVSSCSRFQQQTS